MTAVLSPGDRGEVVRGWQALLKAVGHDPGAADGMFGRRTMDATNSFQAANNLELTGVVTLEDMAAALLIREVLKC